MNAAELRKLAEAATPGPWTAQPTGKRDEDGEFVDEEYDDWCITVPLADADNAVSGLFDTDWGTAADARFVAAANPAAVLELLAEIDQLNYQLDAARGMLDDIEEATSAPAYPASGAGSVSALVDWMIDILRDQPPGWIKGDAMSWRVKAAHAGVEPEGMAGHRYDAHCAICRSGDHADAFAAVIAAAVELVSHTSFWRAAGWGKPA